MTGLSGSGRYRDWSMSGWREHLPGVADVPAFAEELAGDTIPALAAASATTGPATTGPANAEPANSEMR